MIPASGNERILQENSENRWTMEAVFQPEFVGFFVGDFPAVSRGNALENGQNLPEKIRRLSGRNTAFMFH
jgi:hypothetical protein